MKMSIAIRLFQKVVITVFSSRMHLLRVYLLAGLLALAMLILLGTPQQADGSPEIWNAVDGSLSGLIHVNDDVPDLHVTTESGGDAHVAAGDLSSHAMLYSSEPLSSNDSFAIYLPIVIKPAETLVTKITMIQLTLPQPLAATSGSWCTWGTCSLSPRRSGSNL